MPGDTQDTGLKLDDPQPGTSQEAPSSPGEPLPTFGPEPCPRSCPSPARGPITASQCSKPSSSPHSPPPGPWDSARGSPRSSQEPVLSPFWLQKQDVQPKLTETGLHPSLSRTPGPGSLGPNFRINLRARKVWKGSRLEAKAKE